MRWLPLLLLLLSLTGCAWLQDLTREQMVEQARADDAICVAQGSAFPAENYVNCRLHLADARQKDAWLELRLMEQQQQLTSPGVHGDLAQGYRPIRAEDFHCERRFAADAEYIYCGE